MDWKCEHLKTTVMALARRNAWESTSLRMTCERGSWPRASSWDCLALPGPPRWRILMLPFLIGFPGAQSVTLRNRSALTITETELSVIARLAIIGFNSSPTNG